MKITRCATAVVEANYDYTYVRIHADNGVYGTGECFFAAGLTAALREMFPLLIGRDPRRSIGWRGCCGGRDRERGRSPGICTTPSAESRPRSGTWWGRAPVFPCTSFWAARCATRCGSTSIATPATTSRAGARCSKPRRPRWLAEALAGKAGTRIATSPTCIAARAQMVAAGFDALKFDIDSIVVLTGEELNRPLHRGEIDRMVECVAAAREGAGDRVDLAVDCHWRFAPTEAIRIARALAPFNLIWLEDPCPPENWRDMSEIRRRGAAPSSPARTSTVGTASGT